MGGFLNLKSIKQVNFPSWKYFRKVYPKNQVYLHHTVSGKGVSGDIAHWIKSKFRIGTCVIISRDGTINQVFSSKYWAFHLGVKSSVYKRLGIPYKRRDMTSIGIEIDSYGGLRWDASINQWRTVYGNVVPLSRVVEYPKGYRGFYAFEKYTDAQIEATRQLLVYWNGKYEIPLTYHADMWELNRRALSGVSGVWSHTSVREDKSDCHPQKELISMLKNLTK